MRRFIEPIQSEAGSGEGGMTWATGLPNRVIRCSRLPHGVEQRPALHGKLKDRNFLQDSN